MGEKRVVNLNLGKKPVVAIVLALNGSQVVPQTNCCCQVATRGSWMGPVYCQGLPGGLRSQNECFRKYFLPPGGKRGSF